MSTNRRHSKREYPSSSRRSSPDHYNLNHDNRESSNERKSRSPKLGRVAVSISNPSSPHSSHRSSAFYENKSTHYHNGGYNGSSEVDNLKRDIVKGNLKSVRSDLEVMKSYYGDLERAERQKSVSKSLTRNDSVGLSNGFEKKVIGNPKYKVSNYKQENHSIHSTFSTPVNTYKPKSYDRGSTFHQPTYTQPSYPTHTPIAKTVSYPSYKPPRAISMFPNHTTATKSAIKPQCNTNDDYKTYSIDYYNLYKDFQSPLFTPTKHIDRFPSDYSQFSKLARSQSAIPEYTQKPLSFKPLKEFNLSYYSSNQATSPHHSHAYHPIRSPSAPRIFDLNRQDKSLMRKDLHIQTSPIYQPIHYHTPHMSRRNSEVIVSSHHHGNPYKSASSVRYHDLPAVSRSALVVEEPKILSSHRYDSSSSYLPTHRSSSYVLPTYSSSLPSPPSDYEPLDLPSYKTPVRRTTFSPRLSPIPPLFSSSKKFSHQQPSHVSTHNVVFQPAVGVQNNQGFMRDYDKRKIHTVESVIGKGENNYKPATLNNHNITTTKKSNYNTIQTKPAYNKYHSTIEPISRIPIQQHNLLNKKYSVDFTQSYSNIETDRHQDREIEVGTKLVHIKPRRSSEVYSNTYNNQFNNLAAPRNKMMSFNLPRGNNSGIDHSDSHNMRNPRNSNTEYHDAHFFENRNKQQQQVITPPTRITAPQAYMKKRN